MDIKRNPMRVVGYSYDFITIQRFVFGRWNQITLTQPQFMRLLKYEFPDYLEEYEITANGEELFDWFFRYEQTGEPMEYPYVFR